MKTVVIAAVLMAGATAANAEPARQVLHHDATGNPIIVTVIAGKCPDGQSSGCYLQHVVWRQHDKDEAHELAHAAGMRHTPWVFNRWGIPCTRITVAGFSTGYEVGQVICQSARGEYVDSK